MIRTYAELIFHPTEVSEKLHSVLHNLFDIDEAGIKSFEKNGEDYLSAEMDGVEGLYKLFNGLRKQRIVQSARKILFGRMDTDSVSFLLNKQALLMGKYHFCHSPDESPMGPVWVEIKSDNIEKLLEYLVPETRKGIPMEVNYLPE